MPTLECQFGCWILNLSVSDVLDRLCGDEVESQCSLLSQRRSGYLKVGSTHLTEAMCTLLHVLNFPCAALDRTLVARRRGML